MSNVNENSALLEKPVSYVNTMPANITIRNEELTVDADEFNYNLNTIEKLDSISNLSITKKNDSNSLSQQFLHCNFLFYPIRSWFYHKSICILDWDDTLLCTSYLQSINVNQNDTLNSSDNFGLLEKYAETFLSIALQFSKVYIVTNAVEGWVEYSGQKYLPSLFKILMRKVSIISAREHYECIYPNNLLKWKESVFLDIQYMKSNLSITNYIIVGDSLFDIEAAQILKKKSSNMLVKTIKFMETSSPLKLAEQLRTAAFFFQQLCISSQNLKISIVESIR